MLASSLTSKAKAAILLTWLFLAACVFVLISDFMQLEVVTGLEIGTASIADAYASDARDRVAVAGLGLSSFLSIVSYLVWVNGANKTLKALGVQGMKFSSAFAVGAYFIPFYQLAAGYQVMEEIWKAGHAPPEENETQWQSRKVSAIVGAWWLLWIAGGIVGRMSNLLLGNEPRLDDIRFATYLSMFGIVCAIGSSILHINVVRQATDAIVKKATVPRQAQNPEPSSAIP